MKLSLLGILITGLFLQGNLAFAESYKSKYIGQEKRTIKSLSQDDIDQLREGRGWGLAKAAELNGVPGPIHVLQMKDRIDLKPDQEQKIKNIYDDMKAKAQPLGNKLIELEHKLNNSFAQRSINKNELARQLAGIAEVKMQLRYTHLVAHLYTLPVLTSHQLDLYNRLRGYDSDDPCASIPKGHDAAMWKKHNGCE